MFSRRLVSLLVLFCLVFALPGACSAADTAMSDDDFITLYKYFFKKLVDKDYTSAWNMLTDESKMIIAKAIADETKGKAGAQDVLQMLDTNDSDIRTKFFEGFMSGIGDFFNELLSQGKFSVKFSSVEKAVLTIEVRNDPRDFEVLKVGQEWKLDFFCDLMK